MFEKMEHGRFSANTNDYSCFNELWVNSCSLNELLVL